MSESVSASERIRTFQLPVKLGSAAPEYLSISAAVIDLKLNLFTDVSNDMCITNITEYEAINT